MNQCPNSVLKLEILFCFLLLMLFAGNVKAQSNAYKYILQTSEVGRLKIRDDASGKTYEVPSYLRSGGGYLISCSKPDKAYILVEGSSGVAIKLLSVKDSKRSEWVKINTGTPLSLRSVIERYPEKGYWERGMDMLQSVADFFNECRYGRTAPGKDAAMKAGMISFLPTDTVEYIQPSSWNTRWVSVLPVTSLKLHSVTKNKLLWEGVPTHNDTWQWSDIPVNIVSQIKPGHTFQVEIFVRDKEQQVHSATQVIYIYNKKERNFLEQFLNSQN